MIPILTTRRLFRLGFTALIFSATLAAAVAGERKMEARLIWGTNDEKSPDPSHKPLDGEIARKLRDMPLKWKNFFEVNRKVFVINDQSYTNVPMSKKCSIEVKDKGGNNVTVKLYGQGKPVNRVDKPLPKGELLAIGGDDKNNSAWFITVRPVNGDTKPPEPKKENKVIVPAAQPAAAKPAPTK
jgi:hypothetical protein